MQAVTVRDEALGGQKLASIQLEFAGRRVTVRELITTRVRREVERYNRTCGERFEGLVQPSESERVLNGYRMKQRRPVDAELQILRALDAFSRNGFFVLVGDRQADSLEDEIELCAGATVSFVRLTPLVGG